MPFFWRMQRTAAGVVRYRSISRSERLSVPPLSEERRKQLVSQIKKMSEQGRVAIRNIRRDQNKAVETAQKKNVFTEDDRDKLLETIQEETKRFEKRIDDLVEKKSAEIMEV